MVKINYSVYKNIVLPESTNNLLNELVDINAQIDVISNGKAVQNNVSHYDNLAMLTQKYQEDEYYQPYTIININEKPRKQSAVELYQILKIDMHI